MILILAIIGLIFIIKETDGPFGGLSSLRNMLMRNKYLGVFFYKLFDCYACTGFYCGMAIYLLSGNDYIFSDLLIWGFAGSAIGILFNRFVNYVGE